jgi:hypothetical protein
MSTTATHQSLRDLVAAKKIEEQKAAGSFHETHRTVSFIEFRPDPHTRSGFAMSQLCNYTLEANPDVQRDMSPERLTLAFSTADVVLFGARLDGLVALLNSHTLEWVAALDARYLNADARPWVGRIVVTRLDKQPQGGVPF